MGLSTHRRLTAGEQFQAEQFGAPWGWWLNQLGVRVKVWRQQEWWREERRQGRRLEGLVVRATGVR